MDLEQGVTKLHRLAVFGDDGIPGGRAEEQTGHRFVRRQLKLSSQHRGVAKELRARRFMKIVSLAPEVL